MSRPRLCLVTLLIILFLPFTVLAASRVPGLDPGTAGRYRAIHSWQSYFQVRYTDPEDKDGYVSLRRLKLYGQGPVSGSWSYYVQFLYKANNYSVTDNRIFLQEIRATLKTAAGKLVIGQFKPPFGMERFTSDAEIALADRSQPTDRLIPNGNLHVSFARDLGFQWERGNDTGPSYALGIFAGSGANKPLGGSGPLVAGRLAYQWYNDDSTTLRTEVALSWRRDKNLDFSGQVAGVPAEYSDFSGSDARGNLALAWDGAFGRMRAEFFAVQYHSDENRVKSIAARGFYVQLARPVSRRWLGAVRYESIDPDIGITNSKDCQWVTLGGTYYINADLHKIQVNYVFKSERVRELENDALILQYQRFF